MPIATSSDKIDLSSETVSEKLAGKLAKKLKTGDIVFLYGEMGVGKTTFVRYLINNLQRENQIKITNVTSPTFSLMHEYIVNHIRIDHYDLFRLESVDEVKNLNLFSDQLNTITLIEWPEIIEKKPNNLIELIFKYEENYQKRTLEIKGINL